RQQVSTPGAYPASKDIDKKSLVHNKRHLSSKPVIRIKNYFYRLWKKTPSQQINSNSLNISVTIPITVNNNYYDSHNEKPTSSSIMHHLVALNSNQIYVLLAFATLFLLVIAFALLQVHRTLSILQMLLEG
ncbi:hypothetical protein CU098_003139, partial [Rhizopus stolonifer]